LHREINQKIIYMAQYEVLMPKMGESVEEATITKWFKKEGDLVEEDDVLLEIATDKVDSEIPSPVDGKLIKVLFKENDLVPVGKVIAIIDLDGENGKTQPETEKPEEKAGNAPQKEALQKTERDINEGIYFKESKKFYSPLVKSIASKEKVGLDELEKIQGTGSNGRVTKNDILAYIKSKDGISKAPLATEDISKPLKEAKAPKVMAAPGDEIVEMDRMRKMIADHMVMSKQVSPHVTNFIEADVTNLVFWRNKVKDAFKKREKTNFTYMPVFIEAVANALRDYPGVNSSVDGYNIIMRKHINVGIAVALPTGNLIVPVIKNADQKNLVGLAVEMNELAEKARINKLSPDDIQAGTFSISNFGSFRNAMGTPIINQPQVAILAVGTIEKKPAVLETPTGDVIAIRHKMFLSLTYDHRVVDGALGGAFLRKIADNLEQFDTERSL
jgi:2-oxoglutarate dehydrogenase E2 component (dihydrolipoamide succinyltransferase)